MRGVNDWLSYECAWIHRHSQCDGLDCACYCHQFTDYDDEEDPFWTTEPPNDEPPE